MDSNAQEVPDAALNRAQSSNGATTAVVSMSTPIFEDGKSKSAPNVSMNSDVAPVIAFEINDATPLQSDQCQGSPRDGLPLSCSPAIVNPGQGKHLIPFKPSGPTTLTRTIDSTSAILDATARASAFMDQRLIERLMGPNRMVMNHRNHV